MELHYICVQSYTWYITRCIFADEIKHTFRSESIWSYYFDWVPKYLPGFTYKHETKSKMKKRDKRVYLLNFESIPSSLTILILLCFIFPVQIFIHISLRYEDFFSRNCFRKGIPILMIMILIMMVMTKRTVIVMITIIYWWW